MNPVKSHEALKIWLNTLRLTAPNIDTELHKTRGVQLMKLNFKPFQHANNKRVRRKPQTDQEEFLINNNLVIKRIGNNPPSDGLTRSQANQPTFANSSKSLVVTLDRPNSKLTASSEAESATSKLSTGFAVFFTRAINLQNAPADSSVQTKLKRQQVQATKQVPQQARQGR